MIKTYKQDLCPDVTDEDLQSLKVKVKKLSELHGKWQTIFMWQDGPLIQAMRDGDLFLVDEISLADDSVLERLNSVLEPERTLVGYFFLFYLFKLVQGNMTIIYPCVVFL